MLGKARSHRTLYCSAPATSPHLTVNFRIFLTTSGLVQYDSRFCSSFVAFRHQAFQQESSIYSSPSLKRLLFVYFSLCFSPTFVVTLCVTRCFHSLRDCPCVSRPFSRADQNSRRLERPCINSSVVLSLIQAPLRRFHSTVIPPVRGKRSCTSWF